MPIVILILLLAATCGGYFAIMWATPAEVYVPAKRVALIAIEIDEAQEDALRQINLLEKGGGVVYHFSLHTDKPLEVIDKYLGKSILRNM